MEHETSLMDTLKNGLKDIHEKFDGKYQELNAVVTDLAQKRAGGGALIAQQNTNAIAQWANNTEVKSFVNDRGIKSVSVSIKQSLPTMIKSVVGDVAGAGNNLYSVQAQRGDGLGENAQRRLSVFDTLPKLPMMSNSFEYNTLDSYINAANYQTKEGVAKTQAAMPTELITAPITTIAHFIKLSEQVLADVPSLTAQVTNLLRYGVMAKASAEIISGSTAGKIQGLATLGTVFVTDAALALADAIGGAITSLDATGWQANLVIIHPNDWFAIQSERSTDDEYVAGGWATPNANIIWGVQVITDPAVAEGNPIVLDTTQVAILDRMDARVELGREGNDMTTNQITCLAETRIGLAVFSPSAVLVVTPTV